MGAHDSGSHGSRTLGISAMTAESSVPTPSEAVEHRHLWPKKVLETGCLDWLRGGNCDATLADHITTLEQQVLELETVLRAAQKTDSYYIDHGSPRTPESRARWELRAALSRVAGPQQEVRE